MPRLLAVTTIWPSAEAPGLGAFVRNRFAGVPDVTVVVGRQRGRNWLLNLLGFARQVLAASGRFDGVEAHVLYPAGLVGLLVARVRRIPLLAYAHGTDLREVPIRGRGYRFFVTLVARHADLLVTNSADSAAHARGLGVSARIIPPGIDTDLFRPSPRLARGKRRVLYLGGKTPGKGYAVARDLADTLVGPGLREIEPREVARLLAEHDVLLVPSRAEAFGLVAVEAIASGRWVVANRVGGLPDIVRDGVNGTLVEDGDYAAALAAVPDYDPEAISRTVEHLSVRRWQTEMAAAWEQLLAGRGGLG